MVFYCCLQTSEDIKCEQCLPTMPAPVQMEKFYLPIYQIKVHALNSFFILYSLMSFSVFWFKLAMSLQLPSPPVQNKLHLEKTHWGWSTALETLAHRPDAPSIVRRIPIHCVHAEGCRTGVTTKCAAVQRRFVRYTDRRAQRSGNTETVAREVGSCTYASETLSQNYYGKTLGKAHALGAGALLWR